MAPDVPPPEENPLQADLDEARGQRDLLRTEVSELRAELSRLRQQQAIKAAAGQATGEVVGKVALSIAMGLGVRRAFERLFQAMHGGDLFPVQEMADLGAAVVRRMVFTQLLGTFIAVLPLLLLIQQNWLLTESNTRDAQHARVARSTHLIELLYEVDCPSRLGDTSCEPMAPARLRSEAAKSYVELERELENQHINLSEARLDQVVLRQVDFAGVDLEEAMLNEADLRGADLTGAVRAFATGTDADLTDADLADANLRGADFARAELRRVDFGQADLRAANLEAAVLHGADLSDVQNLPQARVSGATYSESTRFPERFKPDQAGLTMERHPRD